MDNNELKQGFELLNDLAQSEYHSDLTKVLKESDAERSAIRVGRLVGVLLKEPFATKTDLRYPTPRTAAYRSWQLQDEIAFEAQSETWQYKTLEQIRSDLSLKHTPLYQLAQDAHNEFGFFGYVAQVLCKYICGDKELRIKVAEALKTANLSLITPETIIAAGGLSLGTYLVQNIPALEFVGAPVIAAIVLIIYRLGIEAFCSWSHELRMGDDEKG